MHFNKTAENANQFTKSGASELSGFLIIAQNAATHTHIKHTPITHTQTCTWNAIYFPFLRNLILKNLAKM